MGCSEPHTNIIVVDIRREIERYAIDALKEQYGEGVPEIKEFGMSLTNIGFVWTLRLIEPDQLSVVPILEHPPSSLDDISIDLPDNAGKGWRKKRDSYLAMWWWIIFNVPSMNHGRRWAELKLRDNKSVALIHGQTWWCNIYRQSNGSIWLEYKGRKMVLDE
jgi:hypothetical protein